MIDVSIVIISWRMRNLLEVCLKSLIKFTTGINYEIILIDNNSMDGTSEMIKNDFSEIKLIINEENRGVAPARNQGLEIAKGKYVLILDADMEFKENAILELYNFMESNKECGLAGCKLVDTNGTLQYSCKRFPSLLALISRRLENFDWVRNSEVLNYHVMKEWDHNSIREVDYLIGACQFFRREVIDRIGYYDDKIFYGPEDIDMCIRVWRSGWKIFYYPFTTITHHEQRITKKNVFSMLSLRHLKGIIYLFKKYRGKISA